MYDDAIMDTCPHPPLQIMKQNTIEVIRSVSRHVLQGLRINARQFDQVLGMRPLSLEYFNICTQAELHFHVQLPFHSNDRISLSL